MSDKEEPSKMATQEQFDPIKWRNSMQEIETILQKMEYLGEIDEKAKAFAKTMHWMLNIGFVLIIVDYCTVRSLALGIAGSLLMAVPIAWISWKEGL